MPEFHEQYCSICNHPEPLASGLCEPCEYYEGLLENSPRCPSCGEIGCFTPFCEEELCNICFHEPCVCSLPSWEDDD